jgi:hypothetical protein
VVSPQLPQIVQSGTATDGLDEPAESASVGSVDVIRQTLISL